MTDALLAREAGKALLLADVAVPKDFYSVVTRLAGSADLRKDLQQGAHQLYERDFTWKSIAARLLSTLGEKQAH